jgi:hypothetical protein
VFNHINNELSELEKIVDSMSDPIEKCKLLGTDDWRNKRKIPDRYIVLKLSNILLRHILGLWKVCWKYYWQRSTVKYNLKKTLRPHIKS